MRKIKMILAICTMMLFASCTSLKMDFTVLSTRNVTLPVLDKNAKRVESGWFSTIKEASDDAIAKAGYPYDALKDGVVYQKQYYYWLYSIYYYQVEATPVCTWCTNEPSQE